MIEDKNEANFTRLLLEEINNRLEEEIKELRDKMEGVPERLKGLEEQFAKLSVEISDFIKELRKGYVSHEVCRACMASMQKDIEQNRDNIRFMRNILWALCGGCISLLVGALVTKVIN